jgi:hypothetical protein
MALQRIRLELARTPDFPEGSPDHGYDFMAPLTADGHIDAKAWKDVKDRCEVTRFWAGEFETGLLRHVGGGWRFDYAMKDDTDDEPFFKLDRHALTPSPSMIACSGHSAWSRLFRLRVSGAFAPCLRIWRLAR